MDVMKFARLRKDGNVFKHKIVFGIQIDWFMIVSQILQHVLKHVEMA